MIESLGELIAWLGILLAVIGGIWFIVAAFQEGILWGLAVLFFPFMSLVFTILAWDRARRPFMLQLLGIALVFFAIFILSAPFLGTGHHHWHH